MNIPFLSLKDVTALHGAEINEAVTRVVNGGWYLQGDENNRFEEDYAKFKKFADKGKMEKLAKLLNEKLTGTQTDRKTFISTSVGPKADFLDNPKITTRLYIGEGVKGAFVSADPELIKFKGENEYLLAPNTQSTVMGVEYNPETKGLTMHVFLGEKQ